METTYIQYKTQLVQYLFFLCDSFLFTGYIQKLTFTTCFDESHQTDPSLDNCEQLPSGVAGPEGPVGGPPEETQVWNHILESWMSNCNGFFYGTIFFCLETSITTGFTWNNHDLSLFNR